MQSAVLAVGKKKERKKKKLEKHCTTVNSYNFSIKDEESTMHAVTIIVIMNALWYKSLNGCSDKKCNLYYSDGSKTETEDDRKYIRQNVNSDVHVSNKYENDSGHVIVSFSALWR